MLRYLSHLYILYIWYIMYAIAYLLQLLCLFEIFYRNPTSVIFKMAAVPANFNFQIGSISENVLHDLCYNYAKLHAFTTFWTIVLKICTDRLDYIAFFHSVTPHDVEPFWKLVTRQFSLNVQSCRIFNLNWPFIKSYTLYVNIKRQFT